MEARWSSTETRTPDSGLESGDAPRDNRPCGEAPFQAREAGTFPSPPSVPAKAGTSPPAPRDVSPAGGGGRSRADCTPLAVPSATGVGPRMGRRGNVIEFREDAYLRPGRRSHRLPAGTIAGATRAHR